jgi:hypothetical protein
MQCDISSQGRKMLDMHGARHASCGAAPGMERRLAWGQAALVIAALSLLSWAALVGLVAALQLVV